MFQVIVGLGSLLFGAHLVIQVGATIVAAAMILWWEDFGLPLLQILGLVMFAAGVFYYGFVEGVTMGIEDLLVVVAAGVLGAEPLYNIFGMVVDTAFSVVDKLTSAVVDTVDKVVGSSIFPFLLLGGLGLMMMSGSSSDNGSAGTTINVEPSLPYKDDGNTRL